ncbi:MAG: uroporphyrinogen decarboxylase family protein [Victivallales bacterium]|jgi:uroporphyrinogen decarboxylase
MRKFIPDYRNIEAAARNKRAPRLPFYEHLINAESMEKITGKKFNELINGDKNDIREYFRNYSGFFLQHEYDTVSFECCVGGMLPNAGALGGHKPGAIHCRRELEEYPWDKLAGIYWDAFDRIFEAMKETLPHGMKAVGGIGNGVFEIAEDLVGFESLCLLQADEPDTFSEPFVKIGDLLVQLWTEFMRRHADAYAVCRIGDDMGFKTSTLLSPQTIIDNVVPQYSRVIKVIHSSGKPFLFHSCGCIFDVMDNMISAGIDAKHSNEDAIAPYDEWISRYGDKLGLFGGIDTDRLCRMPPDDIYEYVLESATRFRAAAKGYALGSGNSTPPYVPAEGYLAMIAAGREIRRRECT